MIASYVKLDHPAGELLLTVNLTRVDSGVMAIWTLLKRTEVIKSGVCCVRIPDVEPRSLYSAVRDAMSAYEESIDFDENLADQGGLSTLCEARICCGMSMAACLDDCLQWIVDQADYL